MPGDSDSNGFANSDSDGDTGYPNSNSDRYSNSHGNSDGDTCYPNSNPDGNANGNGISNPNGDAHSYRSTNAFTLAHVRPDDHYVREPGIHHHQ